MEFEDKNLVGSGPFALKEWKKRKVAPLTIPVAMKMYELYLNGYTCEQICNINGQAYELGNGLALPKTTKGLPQKGPALPPSENVTRDPFIEAVLNKTTCYVNEPIIYTFRLYSKRTTWADTNLIPPSFKGSLLKNPGQ
jgi:hypothetical protein